MVDGGFSEDLVAAARREPEVALTTIGRSTGKPARVVIWVSTDGRRLFIRSGGGLGRHWPQNVLASGRATLHISDRDVEVGLRHVDDPQLARTVSRLVRAKYGDQVRVSSEGEPLTPGESATFELLPAR